MMWEIEPVGTLRIVPTNDGCEQILLGAVMNDVKARRTGKESVVIAMNASLKDLTMRNAVSAVKSGTRRDRDPVPDRRRGHVHGGSVRGGGQPEVVRHVGLVPAIGAAVVPRATRGGLRGLGVGQARGKRTVNVTQVAGEILAGGKGSCLRAWRSRRWSGGEDVRM